MLSSFFDGLSAALLVLLPFAVGPASFAILQTSINKGFYSGMQLAIGILLSDVLLMALCYFGLTQFTDNQTFNIVSGIAGTGLLMLFGIYMFRKKTIATSIKQKELRLKVNWLGVFSEIGKGFGLNFMNPFLWFLWAGIISVVVGKPKFDAILFMAGIAVVLFSADLLKSFFANRLTTLLSPKVILIINKIAGIILIIGAVYLFYRTCTKFNLHTVIPWV